VAKGREVRVPGTDDKVVQAIQRAAQGDQEALFEVRKGFDADPLLWRFLGDMARRAEEALVTAAVVITDLARQEAARRAPQGAAPCGSVSGEVAGSDRAKTRFLIGPR
jgi:hypothetical protein